MTYVSEREEYGRPRKCFDVRAFATDLAKAMGGTMVPPKPDNYDHKTFASFILDLGGDVGSCEVGMTLGWRGNEWDKVTVRVGPSDCKLSYNELPRGDEYKLPDATVTGTRPLATLVKDIKRRVIEPAKAPIAKRRAYAVELKQKANRLTSIAKRLRQEYHLDVRLQDGATYNGTIYSNGDGRPYLSGQFYADGTVSIDRLGTLSPTQFDRVMRALGEEPER